MASASNPCQQTPASPWGKPTVVQPCSLEDVMSEQLATALQKEEENTFQQELLSRDQSKLSEAAAAVPTQQTDAELAAQLASEDLGYDPNDETIALMLQKEFDREYDSALSKREQKYNGNSKVSISFDNYKRRHQPQDGMVEEDDDDDDFYEEEKPNFPNPSKWESNKVSIGNRGYSGQGKNIVTKHDKVINGRKNAERLMEFPPSFGCGDGEGMDMQLPNQVYNKLKRHSLSENKKSHKVHEKKDHSTAIKAVDEKTRILIFKMINSELLRSVDGVVSEGKEAVVFKAVGGQKENVEVPEDVILKVYKTSMNEFKTRLQYIIGDYRLSKDVLKKYNPRKVMRMWAEKEFLNLKKLYRRNVPCPLALALKKHVLAMSCIGGEKPAPKLRDVTFSAADLEDAYDQTVRLMKLMYNKCNMVHADLSAYNLLWHDGKVWVIDVGQAVDRENANSPSFLLRDCKNICDFFRQRGVYNVPSAESLFNDITKYSMQGEGKVLEAQVQRYEKEEYSFDYFFEMSTAARLQKLDLEESDSESDDDDEEEEQQQQQVDNDVNKEDDIIEEKSEEEDSPANDTSTSCSTVNGRVVVD